MSIHINPATNPCGQDINAPLTTSRLLCQRRPCFHTVPGSQVKAPTIIQRDGSQRPAARNDRHDAGNLDALFDWSLLRRSSSGTSRRHHQDRWHATGS